MTPAIAYTLQFVPQTHTVVVTADLAVGGRPHVELFMAVWTPGSYMVREYARQVTALDAADAERPDTPLSVIKVRKNRWQVTVTPQVRTLRVTYRLYCREMTVRTSWVDHGFALLNGAATFISATDALAQPHDVRLELPPTWQSVHTALPPHPDGAPWHFRASDFDTLVDCPIVAGNACAHPFTVDNKDHVLATVDGGDIWDNRRAVQDVEKIVQYQARFWGGLPYDRYVFLNILAGGRGGLEHKSSCVLAASRWAQDSRADYIEWLGLVSHEFFHVWNIKRLRPVELGPFHYEQENTTRSLWVSEGFTAYYDDLLVHRAGLTNPKEYLQALSKSIQTLQTTPGRTVQSLAESSFDAWIKLYRRDENSDNVAISYYTKGCVVAFLLDTRIRVATANAQSLDTLMRLAFTRYAGERGFTDAQWRDLASEVAGVDLHAFFAHAVDSTQELDYAEALAWYGLAFVEADDKSGKVDAVAPKAGWLGISTKNDAGRLVISEVRRGGPGAAVGLNVDDEVIAIDAYRVTPTTWKDRLKRFAPGAVTSLLIARRESLIRYQVQLGEQPATAWSLRPVAEPSSTQQGHLHAWLTGAAP